MIASPTRKLWFALVWMSVLVAACGPTPEGVVDDDMTIRSALTNMPLGSHLPGISDAAFAAAEANFNAAEGITDGLGPIFNERACGNCHDNGAPGGAGENIERRFGTFRNGFLIRSPAKEGRSDNFFRSASSTTRIAAWQRQVSK